MWLGDRDERSSAPPGRHIVIVSVEGEVVVVVEVERLGRLANPIVATDGTVPPGSPAARLLAGERPEID